MSPRQQLADLVQETGRRIVAMRSEVAVDNKRDGSLVTNADRAGEAYLREHLAAIADVPIWGEEYGHDAGITDAAWLVDPIDGTTNFAYGSPLWGVSVALFRAGQFELAAIDLPELGELYSADDGGAFRNGQVLPPLPTAAIKPSDPIGVNDAVLKTLGLGAIRGRLRSSGAFVIDGTWTATGRYRGMIGMNERLYDVAAAVMLCEKVGAVACQYDGTPMDWSEYLHGRSFDQPWWLGAPR